MASRGGASVRPKNVGYTLRRFVTYLGHAKKRLLLVAFLVTISGLSALLGTYMIKPVVAAVGAFYGGGVSAWCPCERWLYTDHGLGCSDGGV